MSNRLLNDCLVQRCLRHRKGRSRQDGGRLRRGVEAAQRGHDLALARACQDGVHREARHLSL